jgi:hypothetical protein
METERVALKVGSRPEDDDSLLLPPTGRGIAITGGSAGVVLECGSCAEALAKGVQPRQLRGLTVRCNYCGAYNTAPDTQTKAVS